MTGPRDARPSHTELGIAAFDALSGFLQFGKVVDPPTARHSSLHGGARARIERGGSIPSRCKGQGKFTFRSSDQNVERGRSRRIVISVVGPGRVKTRLPPIA